MTARVWVLLALIFGLAFLGLATLKGQVIALALPLVVYLGVSIWLAPGEISLRVTRTISADRVSYGKSVVINVTIANEGARLLEAQLVDIVSPPLDILEGEAWKVTRLQPGEEATLEYTVLGQRGRYKLEGVEVTARDPFELFPAQHFIPAPGRFWVFPEVNELRAIAINPVQTHGFAGPIPSRKPGSGVNFFGVREYQLGDSLRRINWRLSARHGQDLFTNEYEQESIADVGLILDARTQSNLKAAQDSLFEHAVRATASLAETFLNDGHRVGLLIYGAGLERIFPGYGVVQRERILRALAQARTGKNYALESLSRFPTRFFPSRSQLVMVSALLPDDATMLARLRMRGYSLMIVSPNPVEFELANAQNQAGLELPTRLARIERTLLLHNLRRAGIQVVNWQVDRPLDGVLHTSLAQQPTRRIPAGVRS